MKANTARGYAVGFAGWDDDWDLEATSRELAHSLPAFSGIDLESVGDQGLPLGEPDEDAA